MTLLKERKIGLALSGGGIRAAIFHLGLLKWLAENGVLENVSAASTVSGASLGIGLVYSVNHLKWPDSKVYLDSVLPEIENRILKEDIQKKALVQLILTPQNMGRKVNLVADVVKKHWQVTGKLSQLPAEPLWQINCTTFETGKRFQFSQEKMGDYVIGYVENPDFDIADAICSSAGFPILIGPYRLDTEGLNWVKPPYAGGDWTPPKEKYFYLWDGGVYDNLGLEPLYKMTGGGALNSRLDFLIVSNASASIQSQARKPGFSAKNLKRMLDIAMDQVGALRNRSFMDYVKRTENGMYVKIGDSAEYIADAAQVSPEKKARLLSSCMSREDAARVCGYSTTLSSPCKADFDLILRHGYETAKCVYACYFEKE